MQDSNVFIGRIVEIRRFVVPLELYAPTDNRERWDLWVKSADGSERQFAINCRTMPARRGHRVGLATHAGEAVGIVNLTTGARLNFASTNAGVLFLPWELFVAAVFLLMSLYLASARDASGLLLLLLPLANLYFPLLMVFRGMTNSFSGTRADAILDQIERDFGVPSRR